MKHFDSKQTPSLEKKSAISLEYRKLAETQEEKFLHSHAALSKNHQRRLGLEDDHRLPYRRDVDRIIHSKAYARYADKTQVVYLVENDHITHRALHVQLVSNFARGIAEILKLNIDLIEAIALGHDVGHPPFGHEGEQYLSDLSVEYGQTIFAHPWQSCRLFNEIESLNLGLNVYDGFLCHDGGSSEFRLVPRYGKTWQVHEADKELKLANPNANIIPGTLEGCLVKLCDTMSYLGKDIEDAIHLGILDRNQIPQTILGDSNKEILSVLACDVIENSYNKEYIEMSHGVCEALQILRQFNFKNIYVHPSLKKESAKIKRSYRILFEALISDYEMKKEKSYLWEHFLWNRSPAYLESTPVIRMVIDYISGMTDSYFVRTLERFILPARIDLQMPSVQPLN
jgi:dGTPase